MNLTIATGRLTKNPDIRTSGNSKRALFTLAINRPVNADENGNRPADFLPFVAFGRIAEVLEAHAIKGQALEVQAHVETSKYAGGDGETKFSMQLVVDRLQLGAKPRNAGAASDDSEYGDFEDAEEFAGASN